MEIFPDRQSLAEAAAKALSDALSGLGPKSLVVTGGTSPGPVYDRLSVLDLDWADVTVTLSDERWVDARSPDSNERLVRERLLTGRAAAARLLPLKGAGTSPEEDALAVEPKLRNLAPWSAVLLGMGEDGHIASLFPNDPELAARLDPGSERLCVGVGMSGLPPYVARITLTARALLTGRLVVVLITGEAKRAVIERVLIDQTYAPPVAAILRQCRVPVLILWAA
jgi:6-phosphogluconolactonase